MNFFDFAIDNARAAYETDAEANLRIGREIAALPLVVCTGWTEPRHARIVLRQGDATRVSHGMCPACEKAMEEQ